MTITGLTIGTRFLVAFPLFTYLMTSGVNGHTAQTELAQTTEDSRFPYRCPRPVPEEKNNHIMAVEEAFKNQPRMDLIILLDRSSSIEDVYNKTKNFLTGNLLPFLYEYESFIIRPDYVRVRLQTFGFQYTPEFSNILEGGQLLFCNVIQGIRNMSYNFSYNIGTDLDRVLDSIVILVNDSRIRPSPPTKRVLFLLTDGRDVDKVDIEEKIRLLKETYGFTIFTVGQDGTWFANEERIFLQNLASSENHFACLTNWFNFIQPKAIQSDNQTCVEKPNSGVKNEAAWRLFVAVYLFLHIAGKFNAFLMA